MAWSSYSSYLVVRRRRFAGTTRNGNCALPALTLSAWQDAEYAARCHVKVARQTVEQQVRVRAWPLDPKDCRNLHYQPARLSSAASTCALTSF